MYTGQPRLIYFSPTHTTGKIVAGVADGAGLSTARRINLTLPPTGGQPAKEPGDAPAVIGSPVYAGRVPRDMIARFRGIRGNGALAAIIAVYGNRDFEDALVELYDLALEAGFIPIAAGVFIGEHSYSSAATPIAAGRPDAKDLDMARALGARFIEKAASPPPDGAWPELAVPGNRPYKEINMLSGIAPVTDTTLCQECGLCATVCPAAAITPGQTASDADLCIRCCACVKICPAGAKTMDDPRIRQFAGQLSQNCATRKEPRIFL